MVDYTPDIAKMGYVDGYNGYSTHPILCANIHYMTGYMYGRQRREMFGEFNQVVSG